MAREALKQSVAIKGTKHGLIIFLDGSTNTQLLIAELKAKLGAGESFFKGARYSLHATPAISGDTESTIHELCENYGLTPAETAIEPPKPTKKRSPVKQTPSNCDHQQKPNPAQGDTLLLQKNLRSGSNVQHDGNITLLGDVNAGAEIIATGNILVMGTLRGMAHAGCSGDIDAVIVAYKLLPSQLRIADKIARSPESLAERPYPERAYATERDGIIIEKYNPNKRR